jgi:hypothetical protein
MPRRSQSDSDVQDTDPLAGKPLRFISYLGDAPPTFLVADTGTVGGRAWIEGPSDMGEAVETRPTPGVSDVYGPRIYFRWDRPYTELGMHYVFVEQDGDNTQYDVLVVPNDRPDLGVSFGDLIKRWCRGEDNADIEAEVSDRAADLDTASDKMAAAVERWANNGGKPEGSN